MSNIAIIVDDLICPILANQIFYTINIALVYLILFALAEVLHHYAHMPPKTTRKFIHVVGGLIALLFPIFGISHGLVLFLSIAFTLLIYFCQRFEILDSIHPEKSNSVGGLILPMSIYFTYLNYHFFQTHTLKPEPIYYTYFLPMCILAIADPMASYIGRKWPFGAYRIGSETKTMMGSASFFVITLLMCDLVYFEMMDEQLFTLRALGVIVFISILTTVVEAFSTKGLGNLFIPLSCQLAIWILLPWL